LVDWNIRQRKTIPVAVIKFDESVVNVDVTSYLFSSLNRTKKWTRHNVSVREMLSNVLTTLRGLLHSDVVERQVDAPL
jgi:hypothetical protein